MDRKAEIGKHAALLFVCFFVFAPFYIMLVVSMKSDAQFAQQPWSLTFPLQWFNYAKAWHSVSPYIANSLIIASVVTAGGLFCASLAAFAFARYTFPGRQLLFFIIIALMMIPGVLNLIPAFVLVSKLRLLNTRWAVILPGIAGSQAMAIYILRTFFTGIPTDLFDAARIDGAGVWGCYRNVAVPMSKPIIGTLAIMIFVGQWNNYLWPLITLFDNHKKTITIGLAYLTGQHSTDWGPLMAGYVLASLPLIVIFLFSMKTFIRGLATGAIKM